VFRPTLGSGGGDRVTAVLLRHFDRRRIDPSLVLFRSEGELVSELPADLDVITLGARSSWGAWMPAARLLQARKPDVVLSTSSATNVVATLAHLVAGSRSRLVISERNAVFHGEQTGRRRVIVALKRCLYARADLVTCVSRGVAADLTRTLGVPQERLAVVYNPVVDESLTCLASEPVTLPGFFSSGPVVLGVGRLVAQKDFGTLLRAFSLVRAKNPAKLVILGEGPAREQLGALARELGVADDFCMPGFDKNPFKYMAKSTVFVLSSRHEGLPGVLIQAMACGTAVVSTDCDYGPAEIIASDGNDGFLVPVGDVGAMADRISRLLDEPELRRHMCKAAKSAAQRFNAKEAVRRYEAAILGESFDVCLNAHQARRV
jgi:glycosyltransferase involved in cell wall biosynthesis